MLNLGWVSCDPLTVYPSGGEFMSEKDTTIFPITINVILKGKVFIEPYILRTAVKKKKIIKIVPKDKGFRDIETKNTNVTPLLEYRY